jgi:ParB-like chromosome segregation protein Spo0J
MIDIKCKTNDTLKIGQVQPFQGDLKKRTEKDTEDLACSILRDGLLMPFVVWRHDSINSLLDGHGRLNALNDLLYFDNDIAT